MGLKKKIKKLLGTLEGVFKGPEYHKRLKKEEAFTKLIASLEKRRKKVRALAKDANKPALRKELKAQLDLLDVQIKRAHNILHTIQKKQKGSKN